MGVQVEASYLFWEADFRLFFEKHKSFHDVFAFFGPFENICDLAIWRDKFMQAIKERVLRMPEVSVAVSNEVRTEYPESHVEEAEECGFIPIGSLTPEEEGRSFFGEAVQQWIYEFNLPFE